MQHEVLRSISALTNANWTEFFVLYPKFIYQNLLFATYTELMFMNKIRLILEQMESNKVKYEKLLILEILLPTDSLINLKNRFPYIYIFF